MELRPRGTNAARGAGAAAGAAGVAEDWGEAGFGLTRTTRAPRSLGISSACHREAARRGVSSPVLGGGGGGDASATSGC